ncbi:imidazole glycerol phosphate synthase subunit HisH [Ferruginibacter sp. SUN002]|uniref:imidazole glycerol phosphate synthase subunit HisH n=1 Tax=Ferruginibacter sp. SUN002 TaxID=2937789 RepID=UPI003D364FFD
MITIIDYNTGNLGSIKNMLKRLNVAAEITGEPDKIATATKLILPGVGHFDYGMQQLNQSGLIPILNKRVIEEKIPILGICLGVQLLTEGSEEGVEKGLGWIKGKTIAFDKSKLQSNQKIPHMGWTDVTDYTQSKLFEGMYEEPRFYFVHSFHLSLANENDCLVKANYGYKFAAGIEHGNILGTQFHPEKSHKFGMKLLENFSKNY